jgi:hypothetical protein
MVVAALAVMVDFSTTTPPAAAAVTVGSKSSSTAWTRWPTRLIDRQKTLIKER